MSGHRFVLVSPPGIKILGTFDEVEMVEAGAEEFTEKYGTRGNYTDNAPSLALYPDRAFHIKLVRPDQLEKFISNEIIILFVANHSAVTQPGQTKNTIKWCIGKFRLEGDGPKDQILREEVPVVFNGSEEITAKEYQSIIDGDGSGGAESSSHSGGGGNVMKSKRKNKKNTKRRNTKKRNTKKRNNKKRNTKKRNIKKRNIKIKRI